MLHELAATGEWGRYHGPWCDRLTTAMKSLLDVRNVHLCSSGTVAMELALRGVGVAAGDEVLLAAYDYKSNFTNILLLGALPVLVDVRADDAQLDVTQLEAGRTERTKAVIASHLHGGCVDMTAVREWSGRHGIAVIEDACQAHGATVQGRPAGTGGDVGLWSFGGSKLLTAGRGGAVLTNRNDIAQRIKLYTQRGNDAYPLSEMQAAVLLPQLERLSERHQRRRASVAVLRDRLSSIRTSLSNSDTGNDHRMAQVPAEPAATGLSPFPVRDDCDPAYYKVGLWYDAAAFVGLTRERFIAAMQAEGIAIDAGFPALHRIHARSRYRTPGLLPNADTVHDRLLTLHHPVLLEETSGMAQMAAAISKVRAHSTRPGVCAD
ncbi:MAG: DegT/DnrJ/EryC1/StrS family aminotransferase [Planctomycetaceae bacterium]